MRESGRSGGAATAALRVLPAVRASLSCRLSNQAGNLFCLMGRDGFARKGLAIQ